MGQFKREYINMSCILFKLNDIDNIVIEFEGSLSKINCCSLTSITLYFKEQKYCIVKDYLYYYMDLFRTLLIKVINNEFQLHESITKDIGYLGNESFQNKSYLVYEEQNDEWVGEKHSVWSGNGFATWLYNNQFGDIIFEITPFYSFHYKKSDAVLSFIPYE